MYLLFRQIKFFVYVCIIRQIYFVFSEVSVAIYHFSPLYLSYFNLKYYNICNVIKFGNGSYKSMITSKHGLDDKQILRILQPPMGNNKVLLLPKFICST